MREIGRCPADQWPVSIPEAGQAGPHPSFVDDFNVSLSRVDSTRFVNAMTVRLHRGDLPDLTRYTDSVAIDTETMGLHPHRDRLCVVQMSKCDGSADVVQIPRDHGMGQADAPNVKVL